MSNKNDDDNYTDKSTYVYAGLIYILKSLIRVGAINIRTLKKLEFDYTLINQRVYYNSQRFIISNIPAFLVLNY